MDEERGMRVGMMEWVNRKGKEGGRRDGEIEVL